MSLWERILVGMFNLLYRTMYFYSGILIIIIYQKQEKYLERTSKAECAQAEHTVEGELETSSGANQREQQQSESKLGEKNQNGQPAEPPPTLL